MHHAFPDPLYGRTTIFLLMLQSCSLHRMDGSAPHVLGSPGPYFVASTGGHCCQLGLRQRHRTITCLTTLSYSRMPDQKTPRLSLTNSSTKLYYFHCRKLFAGSSGQHDLFLRRCELKLWRSEHVGPHRLRRRSEKCVSFTVVKIDSLLVAAFIAAFIHCLRFFIVSLVIHFISESDCTLPVELRNVILLLIVAHGVVEHALMHLEGDVGLVPQEQVVTRPALFRKSSRRSPSPLSLRISSFSDV